MSPKPLPALFLLAAPLAAQAPDLAALPHPGLLMPEVIGRYQADFNSLDYFYAVPGGAAREARLRRFYAEWRGALAKLDFAQLPAEDQLDWLLLDRRLAFLQRQLDEAEKRRKALEPLLPFAAPLRELAEAQRLKRPQEAQASAELLDRLMRQAREAAARAEKQHPDPLQAQRAAADIKELRQSLEAWQRFCVGYDPLFTWWCAQPAKALDGALKDYAESLTRLAGIQGKEQIVGDPIGREALQSALEAEDIAYTPEEILELGRREMAWCEAELKKAAKDMGCGEDWRAALEKVKRSYVAPGEQPALIRRLADEAVAFLEQRDLVSIPPLAKEDWPMEMMSPEAQKQNPFFLGGPEILVSYPTADMDQDLKLMSLRGNNPAFAHATVFHELIPGHHLQGFMSDRYQTQRRLFETPFYVEGWALYWEMQLWDLGFQRTPEERMGALFWRMHRCARIFFSLGFHLGQLTPQQCVDLLVEKVGHERANAEAEVRRSLQGGYGPLYQAAYMVGGQQLRALHRELVDSGRMSPKAFHDAVLQSGPIPIELLRARLEKLPLSRDWKPSWKFYPADLGAKSR